MFHLISKIAQGLHLKKNTYTIYRLLRKHLDTLPVGFPSTPSGVELRLLAAMFSAEEAKLAVLLDWRGETLEEIEVRTAEIGYTRERLRKLLDAMERQGTVFATISGNEKRYALHPLVIGMFEMQLRRLTASFFFDMRDYMLRGFAAEYLSTEVRQMRVIPIGRSLRPAMAVAAYDDIREIVDRANDRISVAQCICRAGKDLAGRHCTATDRREVCIGFRDFHDTYTRQGWGRAISKKEAMALLDRNERDGLVLMPSTMQEPQFICSCCSCCCGVLETIGSMPRPADFVESNYRAALDPASCKGCGRCVKRCPMGAIRAEGKKAAAVDERKCIGCGVCASTCPSGALSLVRRERQFVPPADHDALYELIAENKKSTMGKMALVARAAMGFRVK